MAVEITMNQSGRDDIREQLAHFLSEAAAEATTPALDLTQPYLGRIVRVLPDRSFGFIRLQCGYQVFFHASSLAVSLNADSVKIGTGVQVRLKPSDKLEGEFDASEVLIIDDLGDKSIRDAISCLVESKRHRELRRVKTSEFGYTHRDKELRS
jgi:hypothetical protein